MKTRRYIALLSLFFGLFVNSSFAYSPSVRDERVVSFFVENLITMVDGIGRDRTRDVLTVLQRMQLNQNDERKTHILGEARNRLALYFNVDRVTITLEGDDDGEMVFLDDNDPVEFVPGMGGVVDRVDALDGMDDPRVVGHENIEDTMELSVYFQPSSSDDCGETRRQSIFVDKNKQILRSSIEALLRGSQDDDVAGLATTDLSHHLLDVQLKDGVAYVNFAPDIIQSWWTTSCGSSSVLAMLEQTVLGVHGVDKVLFALDGSPSSFYETLQLDCPYGLGDRCDDSFRNRTLQTQNTVFAQRWWRLWSNDYSVYFDDENTYDTMTQQVYRVCGDGHGRCVYVFDFLDTDESLKDLFDIEKNETCLENFSGRIQRCQLSDELFVSSISPWKQLVITREGSNMMSDEDMVGLLQVIGQ